VVLFLAAISSPASPSSTAPKKLTGFPWNRLRRRRPLLQQSGRPQPQADEPARVSGKMFVDMPELYVDYRLRSMFSGAPHINDMLINIKQLVVVKTDKGDSNAMNSRASSPRAAAPANTPSINSHSLGTVTLKDYSHPKPTEHNTPLNIDVTTPTSPIPPTSPVSSCSPS